MKTIFFCYERNAPLHEVKYNDIKELTSQLAAYNVQIGHGVKIGDGLLVMGGVKIGDYVRIGDNCEFHAKTTIGNYSKIGNDTTLAGTVIGAEVELGASCSADWGRIGDRTRVAEDVGLGHSIEIGSDTIVFQGCSFGLNVKIGAESRIGIAPDSDPVTLQNPSNEDTFIGDNIAIGYRSHVKAGSRLSEYRSV